MFIISGLTFVWDNLFYFPVVNLIIFIYKYTGNFGITIILLTLLIRLLLWPLVKKQIDSTKKMQDLKPRLTELKKKYKKDPAKFREEQLKLMNSSGVNPVGSCLVILIQLPFLIAVANVISAISASHDASLFNNIVYSSFLRLPSTEKFNMDFLSLNLAESVNNVGFHDFKVVFPYLVLTLIVGLSQYFSTKVNLPVEKEELTETADIFEKKQLAKKGKKPTKEVEKTEPIDPEQFSKVMTTQLLYVMPLIVVWVSLGYPAGLSLYWAVQSIFAIFQILILKKELKWNIKLKK